MARKNVVFDIVLCVLLLCLLSTVFTTLFCEKTSVFGTRVYYIMTESMYPVIEPGQLVFGVDINPEKIKTGDIVSYDGGDMTIIHRVAEIIEDEGGRSFIFKGDNNQKPDEKPVSPEQILFKIVLY